MVSSTRPAQAIEEVDNGSECAERVWDAAPNGPATGTRIHAP